MSYSFTPDHDEKAWLYHRGKWSRIKNPLYNVAAPENLSTSERKSWRRILGEYNRKWWHLGPANLSSLYSGTLVYTYAYNGGERMPEYLIWIDTTGPSGIIYAQDLPDLLVILNILAPIVMTDIFTEAYAGSRGRE